MAINTAALVARQRFGSALKDVRTHADGAPIKQVDVAKAMGLARYDRYSRIERGESWPTDKEWPAIVKCLRMGTEDRVRLTTMLKEGQTIGRAWWNDFEGEVPDSLIEFIAYEDSAAKITTCAGSVIPGILQTPDYGKTLTSYLSGDALSARQLRRSVELRSNRRSVMAKEIPPAIEAIIGEAALRQKVGGVEAMVRQLDSLLDDAAHRQVSFRVVDFDAPATLTYFFHLFEFGEKSESPIAAFDAVTGISFKKNPKEVREVHDFVESLRTITRTPEDSLELIKTIRNELYRDI
ncbi:Scr1 family TA system antitoxin-like transcriptional regulator [Streptomyces sp. NPDC001809]